MKKDSRLDETQCKVRIQAHEEHLQELGDEFGKKFRALSNLDITTQEQIYLDELKGVPTYCYDPNIPERTEHLVSFQAEAYRKSILNAVFEEPQLVESVFAG